MATAEASAYLSAVKWGDEGYYLKEFTQKFKLPQVAKIIKGQYQTLGVPTLPSPTLNQIVFISSAGLRLKIVAQCVKFKDAGRRMVPVGTKIAVPENYDGWFEILSEDGRSVRCMDSVAELARRSPRSCLVRDSIKVHVPRPEDTDSVWDKTRTLSAGEILTVGDIILSNAFRSSNRTVKFLRCVTALGDTVYLPLELRGRFSSIAGEDNISGVHTMRTLMSKRFPLMVRLVHGKPPVGVKSGSQFVPEMRLFSVVEEESLVAMPLLKDSAVVPLPPNAALKVLAPRNADALVKLQEHDLLSCRCRSLMSEVSDCMQVCDVATFREVKHVPPSPQYVYTRRQAPTAYRTIPLVKRSVSDPQGTNSTCRMHLERGLSTPGDASLVKTEQSEFSDSDDYRYEEIDQIYDYVRGFAPLPINIKNEFSSFNDPKSQTLPQISHPNDNGIINKIDKKPPEPPPIETIPARKISNGTVRPIPAPHKITVSIVNRTPCSKTKEILIPNHNHKLRKSAEDHIYEKIDKKNGMRTLKAFDTPVRSPLRSNSASKIYVQNGIHNTNINKLYQKGQSQRHNQQHQQHLNHHPHHQSSKSRFLKQNKNSPMHPKDVTNSNKNTIKVHKTTRISNGVKNLSTSPLFHIRYKSLTDLLLESNKTSPDSSNTSCEKKVGGSASSFSSTMSKEELEVLDDLIDDEDGPKSVHDKRRLSRPKSLSNLIGDMVPRRRVDNHNYYNLVQNDLIRAPELRNPKFYSMPDANRYGKNYYASTPHSRKLGTLYL